MRCWFSWILLASAAATPISKDITRHVSTNSDGLEHTVFHYPPTDSKLDYVTDSGVCETTPNVHQYSGHASVGKCMNMFFWLFEARHNPDTAPLVVYLARGPGDAVEWTVFSENGPCTMEGQNTTSTLSPYSFNEHANVLFIDQPIGTGFSYGSYPITSTDLSTRYIWNFLQAFLAEPRFEKFKGRNFGVIGMSYAGHTGPSLGQDILYRNADIAAGRLQAEKINLTAMGLQNAWMDPGIQVKANLDFAHKNSYRSLINDSMYSQLFRAYVLDYQPKSTACRVNGTTKECAKAGLIDERMTTMINTSAWERDYDWGKKSSLYDIRTNATSPEYESLSRYLKSAGLRRKIDGKIKFRGDGGGDEILNNGDQSLSLISDLTDLLEAGVNLVIFSGDADYICSWPGTLAVAEAVKWPEKDSFLKAPMKDYTVRGVQKGEYKSVKNLSFVRVFQAGHDIALSQPETELQIFEQMLKGKLVST